VRHFATIEILVRFCSLDSVYCKELTNKIGNVGKGRTVTVQLNYKTWGLFKCIEQYVTQHVIGLMIG